jgi:hypothetical protein
LLPAPLFADDDDDVDDDDNGGDDEDDNDDDENDNDDDEDDDDAGDDEGKDGGDDAGGASRSKVHPKPTSSTSSHNCSIVTRLRSNATSAFSNNKATRADSTPASELRCRSTVFTHAAHVIPLK